MVKRCVPCDSNAMDYLLFTKNYDIWQEERRQAADASE